MPDVKMPDGTIIRNVPEGTTRAQLMGRVERHGQRLPIDETTVSQSLSGVNEGIASTLGLPVDLANSVIGLGAKGINAITGSNLQAPDKPFLGSDSIKGMMRWTGSVRPESKSAGNQFARRVGQSVGASAIPIAGTAGSLAGAARMAIPAVTGGIGAATAQQVAPGNPLAEFAAEVVGSGLGGIGVYRSAKKAATRNMQAAVPTIPELKQQASDLYRSAEARGVSANRQQTQALSNRIRDIATNEGLISPTGRVSSAYPKAKEALDLAGDYAKGKMTPTQMQTVRKVLSEAAGSPDNSERRMARMMLETFDDWTAPLAPELSQARSVARRYINAGKLETAKELAGARAGQFTGSGFENALRTDYRALDRRIIKGQERGFDPATAAQISTVSRGTRGSNIARGLGKMAPTGVVSGGISTGVPFAIGTALGGPGVGVGAAVLANALGIGGRSAATRMGISNAGLAELIARNGGSLPEVSVMTPQGKAAIAALTASQGGQFLGKGDKKKKQK